MKATIDFLLTKKKAWRRVGGRLWSGLRSGQRSRSNRQIKLFRWYRIDAQPFRRASANHLLRYCSIFFFTTAANYNRQTDRIAGKAGEDLLYAALFHYSKLVIKVFILFRLLEFHAVVVQNISDRYFLLRIIIIISSSKLVLTVCNSEKLELCCIHLFLIIWNYTVLSNNRLSYEPFTSWSDWLQFLKSLNLSAETLGR